MFYTLFKINVKYLYRPRKTKAAWSYETEEKVISKKLFQNDKTRLGKHGRTFSSMYH